MKPITTRVAQLGNHYPTTTTILGISYPVIVAYTPIKGYPPSSELSEPGVEDYVEIDSVMLEIQDDLILIEVSDEEAETLADEIQESL